MVRNVVAPSVSLALPRAAGLAHSGAPTLPTGPKMVPWGPQGAPSVSLAASSQSPLCPPRPGAGLAPLPPRKARWALRKAIVRTVYHSETQKSNKRSKQKLPPPCEAGEVPKAHQMTPSRASRKSTPVRSTRAEITVGTKLNLRFSPVGRLRLGATRPVLRRAADTGG